MSEIAMLWRELEELLREIVPTVPPTLNPPATDSELNSLQKDTRLVLPNDFRQSLQIHNGQGDPSRLELLTGHGILLSCAEIVKAWRMLSEILDDVGPIADGSEWWNKNYLPIADYEGDFLCIDLTPHCFGNVHLHVHDSTIERNVAVSYACWLSDVRDVLKYRRFSDAEGFIDFWSPGAQD